MLSSGTRLGPYEIVQEIGSGGMGEVYRARDPRIGRDVAIKLISSSVVTTKEKLHRFEQEARATGALNHPNILGVYDVGTNEGLPYLVTEFLEGETLRKRLSAGTIQVRKVIDYAIQIAQGLTAAHAKGIVHRDLKPENIFITKEGRVKILDFGLAKLTQPEATSKDSNEHETISRITDAGIIVGTVAYMSPEQIRGHQIDYRSDLFAFGIILYEMLSGKRPFSGQSNIETMNSILQKDPANISSSNPDVSPALDQIIWRCLEKDANQRFQSASDLSFALQALSMSGSAPMKRMPRAKSKFVLIGVLIVVIAIASMYLYQRQNSTESILKIRSVAVLPLVNLTGDPQQEYFVDGMTEALILDLAKVKALKVIPRTSMMRYKDRKKSFPEIAQELTVDGIIEGSVMRSGDRIRINAQLIHAKSEAYVWSESYERDLGNVLALQKEIARSIVQQIRITVTPQELATLKKESKIDPDAYDAYLKGKFFYFKDWDKSISYFQEAVHKEPQFALAYAYLASIHAESSGRTALPKKALENARITIEKAIEIDESLAVAHAFSGDIYSYEWKWIEAEKELKRSIELDPNCADCYWAYSAHYRRLARLDTAIEMNKRAIELDPLNRELVIHLGSLYLMARDYGEMNRACKKAQELSSDYFVCRWHVVSSALEGRFDEAVSHLHASPSLKQDLVLSAWVYGLTGKRDQAFEILKKLVAQSNKSTVEPVETEAKGAPSMFIGGRVPFVHIQSKYSYVDPTDIAAIYGSLGDKDQAFQWLEKAYTLRTPSMGELKIRPILTPLRSDPRFKDLIQRVGIPD